METIQYMTPIFTPRNNFIMLYTSTKFGSDLRGLSFWNYPYVCLHLGWYLRRTYLGETFTESDVDDKGNGLNN